MSNKPTHSVLLQGNEYTDEKSGSTRNYTKQIGSAFKTEGGAIYIKCEFGVHVDLNKIVIVPNKEKAEK